MESTGPAILPPASIEAITPQWLTGALGSRYPGTEVTAVTVGTVIHGTATKVRLLLAYNDAGHAHRLPPTMWLKGGFEAHSEEQAPVYAGETCFYRDLAEELGIGCPQAYFAHTDPASMGSVLLLEDLLARNASFGLATKPLDLTQAAAMLDLLAGLHAKYWRDPFLQTLGWLRGIGTLLELDVPEKFFNRANVERMLTLPRAANIPPELREAWRLKPLQTRLLEYERDNATCLIHGDPHLGNSFWLPDGTPGFLDWQTAINGHWAHDVGYFITTSLTVADRRHGERDLLDHYLKRMREQGVTGIEPAQAWLEYRRHALYALGWAFCPPELQQEELCAANAERICTALLDLNSVEAWDEV